MADTNLSSLLVSTNPLLNNPDQFPDILQYLNNEDSYKLVEKCANDLDKINKRGRNNSSHEYDLFKILIDLNNIIRQQWWLYSITLGVY